MHGATTTTTILSLTHESKLITLLPSGGKTPPVAVKWWSSGVRSGSKVVVCKSKLSEREVVVKGQKNPILRF